MSVKRKQGFQSTVACHRKDNLPLGAMGRNRRHYAMVVTKRLEYQLIESHTKRFHSHVRQAIGGQCKVSPRVDALNVRPLGHHVVFASGECHLARLARIIECDVLAQNALAALGRGWHKVTPLIADLEQPEPPLLPKIVLTISLDIVRAKAALNVSLAGVLIRWASRDNVLLDVCGVVEDGSRDVHKADGRVGSSGGQGVAEAVEFGGANYVGREEKLSVTPIKHRVTPRRRLTFGVPIPGLPSAQHACNCLAEIFDVR